MSEFDDLNTLDESQPPEESGNKTFLIGVALLAALVICSILGIVGYYFVILRPQANERAAAQATMIAQNTAVSQGLTAKAADLLMTAQVASTPTASNTPPFVQATATATATALFDPQTATVAAALTQAAAAQLTVTGLPTSTLLPNTGFVDDVGGPGLVVMAIALVAVILLARRLRISPKPR